MDTRALLIDDDRKLVQLVTEYLADHDVAVEGAHSGADGLAELSRGVYDIILLDVMMPAMDGLEVLRRIRQQHTVPVIMLTAKGNEADRVVGLELGADDYVPKPFSPRELLARMRAVLRRSQPQGDDTSLNLGGIELNPAARTVRVSEQRLELTALEFDVLATLMRRAGRVVPRETLLDLAGRGTHVTSRSVDVHIFSLRKKLGPAGRQISTVRGVGYLFAKERSS